MEFVTFIIISLILSAALMALSEVLRPKPNFENARPASLGDFHFPTAEEGRVIPLIWGRVMIDGLNVVWYGDFKQEAVTTRVKTGLWSSKRITTGFRYYVGIQMALCLGQIDALYRVWYGNKLVYDVGAGQPSGPFSISEPNIMGGQDFGNGGIDGGCYLYPGSPTQTIGITDYLYSRQSPRIGYQGRCHVVWEGGYVGNSTSIEPFKFEIQRCPNTLGVPSGHHVIGSGDANPMCVIYEILTNTDWGFGFLSTDIDTPNFLTAAATLYTEGNGFSLVLDSAKEAVEILNELQRQIDGVLYLDHQTGKFKIKLARADYTVGMIPAIDATNVIEVTDFTRGTWDETVNQLRVQHSDRAKDYKGTYATASDLANQRIQAGALVSATVNFPGCKDTVLAAKLATRELKYRSTPLAKATIVVNRTLWAIKPGDVLRWTDAYLGFTDLPVRVGKIDYGELRDGKIILTLVQDIFMYAEAYDGEEDPTKWVPPTQAVQAFPAGQQVAMEAPYAITRRDPTFPDAPDRLFVSGRGQGVGEISYKVYQRSSAGVPSGAWTDSGEPVEFMLIGAIRTAIWAGDANPTASIYVDASPDTVADLIAAFSPGSAAADQGQNLVNLIMINDEFCTVTSVVNHTTYIELQTTYRGLLDSVPKDHIVGEPVYLLFNGAGLSDDSITQGYNVHVQLRPRSRDGEVTALQATTIPLTMDYRARRPYPPYEMGLNGTRFDATVDVDTMKSGGTTDDDKGIVVTFKRKDYRNYDEVQSVGADAATFLGDFPAANTTQEDAELILDPDGSPVSAEIKAWATGTSFFFSRTKMLRENAAAKPARLRVEIGTRHTYQTVVYSALEALGFSFDTTASEIDSWENLGVLSTNEVSPVYTAPASGSYAFSIGPNLPGGNIEARINGAGWATVIAGGARTGTLAGVTATDTIEVRNTYAGSTTGETFLHIDPPSGSDDAYAVLIL